MNLDYSRINDYLISAGQGRLALHFSNLAPEEKELLKRDIEAVDFLSLKEAWSTSDVEVSIEASLDPIDYTLVGALDKSFEALGLKILSENRAALLIMAGGMGSRLGFDGPKGAYILSGAKSLFEIHVEELLRVSQGLKTPPLLLIMTSDLNDDYTREFFESHNYFGYEGDRVIFFKQGNLPALDERGEVLLSSKTSLCLLPDGNGGVFRALKEQGILKRLEAEGVDYLQFSGVDNVLLKTLDPIFLGFMAKSGAKIASKSIARKNETEKVGIILKRNGRPTIVEYTEIPKALLKMRDIHGNFVYNDANFASHLFEVAALSDVLESPMPYHRAFKKIPYYDGAELIKPETNNAFKLEHFIFDVFSHFSEMAVLRVDRAGEFSPLKNASGEDSVETARRDYETYRG